MGPIGPTGKTGPKGDTGEQGPRGDTGEQGPKGDSITLWKGTQEEYNELSTKEPNTIYLIKQQ